MSDIDALQVEIAALIQKPPGADFESIEVLSLVYASYAQSYLSAATMLDSDHHYLRHSMPWYQLMGQALELSMKSCLAAAGQEPPRTHDLVRLCKLVEANGFDFGVEHIHALIIHLNHGYYEDLATGDRFAARYGGGGNWIVPDHARLAKSVESLIAQAKSRNALFGG